MADEKVIWVKDPATGKVGSIPAEQGEAGRRAGYVDATQEEADAASRGQQVQGWKGTALAGAAGVASAVPFARNLVREVAPQFGQDMDESAEAHPWVHGAAELATFVAGGEVLGALKGAGAAAKAATTVPEVAEAAGAATKALPDIAASAVQKVLPGEARGFQTMANLPTVTGKVAELGMEAAAEKGIAKAVPSLASRVLGRLPDAAQNALMGMGTGAIELTNEKDLPQTPEALASHIMSTLFWSGAAGAVGGEVMHGLIKAASPVVGLASKALGKSSDALDTLAAALKVGDADSVIAKTRGQLQNGFEAMDMMAKQRTIDGAMEQVRKKVGDAGMGDLDAARIKAETAYSDAKANVMRMLGMDVTKGGKKVRQISLDRLGKALKSDQKADVLEALQALHKAGNGLRDFHEQLAQAGASGVEGLAGKTKEQVEELLKVQDAMKAGIAEAGGQAGMGDAAKALFGGEIGGAVAEHFGHHILGKLVPLYGAARAAKMLWELAPAEFKAARLAQLARLTEGVGQHLDRVAAAASSGGGGKFAAPAAALLSVDELRKLRDDVQEKLANPQKAMDHLQERAGVVESFAPETYGQMGIQYGQQLMTLAGILQWPHMEGPWAPQWMPSETERMKMSAKIAIVKDPKVFEAKLAKGTATQEEAALYKQVHPARADHLASAFLGGLKQGMKADAGTLKAMTAFSTMGLGPARASYSQPTLQQVQGIYSMKASQQGGPGSRGGTGGAKALTASQMITLPGQRVSNRPVK